MSAPAREIIDLTGDMDLDSGSEPEEDLPQDSSAPALAMSQFLQNSESDTLDVSKLNYSFNMIRNAIHKPIKAQFISIRSFLRRLDKNNPAYAFTGPQYCRAWEHAVRLHENEVAVNELIGSNPTLDRAGIERIFEEQMERVIRSVSTTRELPSQTR
jgi:hypothetical protein